MNRLTPETADISGTNEATPLLQDEAGVTDHSLYAIGGGAGYVQDTIYGTQTKTVVQILVSAWMRYPPRRPGDLESEGSDFLDKRALNDLSTRWREIKASAHIPARLIPDSEEIIKGLVDYVVEYLYPSRTRELDDVEDEDKAEFLAQVADIVAEYWQLIFDGIEEEGMEKAWEERIRRKEEKLRRIQERMRRRKEKEESNSTNSKSSDSATSSSQDEAVDPDLHETGEDEYHSIYDSTEHKDIVVHNLFLAWMRHPPKKPVDPESDGYDFIDQSALTAMSTEWQENQVIHAGLIPDSEEIVKGLVGHVLPYMYPPKTKEYQSMKYEDQSFLWAHVELVVEEYWKLILEGIRKEDVEPAVKDRIRRKEEKLWRIRVEMRKRQERKEKDAINNAQAGSSGLRFNRKATGGGPENVEPSLCDALACREIVETLFSAWLQFPPRKPDEPESEDSELINENALNAMSIAWRQLKSERDFLPNSELVIQGLVESVVEYMYPMKPDGVVHEDREEFLAYVTDIVAENWRMILDRIEEEDIEEARKERIRRKKERLRKIQERMERRKEIEEILLFYEPFAVPNPPEERNWERFCNLLCITCSIYIFQIPIHILLLTWPLSIGIMGGLYVTECPMTSFMPYVMMTIGVLGTVALLMRLSLVCYQKFTEEIGAKWLWNLLKFIEFAYLDFLLVQLYYFYSKTPSFTPGASKFCSEIFYDIVHWINYASITLVSMWIFVYFIKGLLWCRRNK